MLRGVGVVGAALVVLACGGSSTDDGGAAGQGASGGSGGVSSGGVSSGGVSSGGVSSGGVSSGGVSSGGVGGSGALGGASSGGGSAGTGGSPTGACAGLSYCDCKASSQCEVYAETCFCPCGIEPCEPNCDCACGGGAYLGCGPTGFHSPDEFPGIWLIGWAGGLNHYSWIRLNPGGTLDVLDGADMVANGPFFPCTGTGSWLLTAKPNTIGLMLPAGCPNALVTYTFENFGPVVGYPKGAILSATAVDPVSPPQNVEAYKFPASQCDASFSKCTDPFL